MCFLGVGAAEAEGTVVLIRARKECGRCGHRDKKKGQIPRKAAHIPGECPQVTNLSFLLQRFLPLPSPGPHGRLRAA